MLRWEGLVPPFFVGLNMKKAFTLVELLIMLAIIGIIVCLLITAINSTINSTRKAGTSQSVEGVIKQVSVIPELGYGGTNWEIRFEDGRVMSLYSVEPLVIPTGQPVKIWFTGNGNLKGIEVRPNTTKAEQE